MKYGLEHQRRKLEKEPKIGAVILSRYSSRRLPGKALLPIAGKPILTYIIEKLRCVLTNEQLVIATSNDPSDDAIEAHAEELSVSCYRGSLEDVSERFLQAATAMSWDYAIRVNGDNLFIDLPLLELMMNEVDRSAVKFVSNVKDRTFPKGMSIEIVNRDYYASVQPLISSNPRYKEHVTLYLYEHEEEGFEFVYNLAYPSLAARQLALDTEEDLERSKQILDDLKMDHRKIDLKTLNAYFNEKSI